MATNMYSLKRRHFDLPAACSHSDKEYSEQSHCSSNTALSDANSSDVTQRVAKASSGIFSSSRGRLAQSKATQETTRTTRTCYFDIRDVEQTTNPTKITRATLQKAVWTDEKHCSYLNSMEAAFVRNFHDKDHYAVDYSVDMTRHEDCLDDDCVESRPPNDNNYSEDSEAFGSLYGYSEHLVQKIPEPCTVISKLVTSLCDKESNSKLSRYEGKPSDERYSVSFTDDHQSKTRQTKKWRVATEQEFPDLELRLGDLRTRSFHRFYTPTFG